MSVRDPDIIRSEIEDTRQELGEAVEVLAAKTNVKARAREKFHQAKESASELPHKARERPAVVVAVGIAILVVIALRRN